MTPLRLFGFSPRLDIMELMKRLLLFLSCCAALMRGAELSDVHKVYVLAMSHGMDQYLANRLTNDRVFQVVTDPKLADAILTDHLGEGFQAQLEEIFPTPAPEKPAADAEKKDESKGDLLPTETVNKLANPALNSSFGRGKGMVFLVDAKSRQVIWSAYELPRDSSAKYLDRTASDIVSRIKRDLKKK
jgi:hypothetical protein